MIFLEKRLQWIGSSFVKCRGERCGTAKKEKSILTFFLSGDIQGNIIRAYLDRYLFEKLKLWKFSLTQGSHSRLRNLFQEFSKSNAVSPHFVPIIHPSVLITCSPFGTSILCPLQYLKTPMLRCIQMLQCNETHQTVNQSICLCVCDCDSKFLK